MPEQLASAIGSRDATLLSVFAPAFSNADLWEAYLERHFGNPPSVLSILNRPLTGPADFQALYVACWIHRPVEKGAFMIPLSGERHANVLAGYGKLGFRMSSHMSGRLPAGAGRSAGAGWEFLKGYSELLVHLNQDSASDTPFLFLKTEGHSAMSVAHLSSWVTKIFTGRGQTQSRDLHAIAEDARNPYGIVREQNEYYLKPYEKLLKKLGFSSNTTTAVQAIDALVEKCHEKARKYNVRLDFWSPQLIDKATGRRHSVRNMSNAEMAGVITLCLIPTIGQLAAQPGAGDFRLIAYEAIPSLRSLADSLRKDAANLAMLQASRYFQEVRVGPQQLDDSLRRFKARLDWEGL